MKLRKNLVLPLALGIIIGSITTATAGTYISAYKNTEMKITYNGQVKTFVDSVTGEVQTPILYNDRTYLPVRAIAELTGLNVGYEDTTETVKLSTSSYVEPQNPKQDPTFQINDDPFLSTYSYYDSIPSGYWGGDTDAYKNTIENLYSTSFKNYSDSDIKKMVHTNSPVRNDLIDELIELRDTLKSTSSLSITTSNYQVIKYIFKNGLWYGTISSIDVSIYNNGSLLKKMNKKIFIIDDKTSGNFAGIYGTYIPQ